MPRGNFRTNGINQAGYGKQGYCKLCSIADPDLWQQYQQRVKAKWSPTKLNDWARATGHPSLVVAKDTLYSHRKHLEHPQDRMVSAVQKTQQAVVEAGPQSSPTEFLEALVSVGHKRVMENPEEVSIDHALRAAQQLSSQRSASSGMSMLIAAITGAGQMKNVTIIDGDSEEQ